jgi:lysophospholipase L1-like esterase
MRVRRWVALGDSFTAGTDPGAPRWADDLADGLRRTYPGCSCENLAIAGATAQEVAAEQLEPAIALRPDLVSVVCGANDVLLSVRPDIPAVATALSGILARLRAELPGAAIVTATYPDVTRFYPLRPRSRLRVARGIQRLNAEIRALAQRQGTVCLDFAAHPEQGVRANFAEDGFHPSGDGHRKAALAFAAGLRHHLGLDLDLEEAA